MPTHLLIDGSETWRAIESVESPPGILTDYREVRRTFTPGISLDDGTSFIVYLRKAAFGDLEATRSPDEQYQDGEIIAKCSNAYWYWRTQP